ncbi:GAF domain-containing protein [Brevundimonas sp.]|uniref:GAF domain-containing protein n=1 Tax=Brevundimonas sp. TaxID=1871086 RepID=UPI0025BEAB32|nr:GAF domain-containing protein [Brevundimonas sp.]
MREARQTLDLDSPFDRLTNLACNIFGMPHAMVSIVDGAQTVFHSRIGLGYDALPREMTLSHYMIAQGPDAVMMVEEGRTDPRTKDHPMVVGPPYLRFFAGVTIVDRFNRAVGAIGVMDSRPRKALSRREVETLRMLGQMASEVFIQADSVRRQGEQLELLRLTEEMAGVGQWWIDVKTRQVGWSDEIYRIFGLDRATFDPTVDDAVALYLEEDRGVLEAALERCFVEGVGYKLRSRVHRADGESAWWRRRPTASAGRTGRWPRCSASSATSPTRKAPSGNWPIARAGIVCWPTGPAIWSCVTGWTGP